jgi:hypothetical protein
MMHTLPARPGRALLVGLVAGAAGTTALNVVTYLDVAVRARPGSTAPEDTAAKLADKLGIDIPGDEDEAANRLAGLGPLVGIAAGVGVGAAVGLARALGFRPPLVLAGVLAGGLAMAAADAPMAVLGVSDPRTWGRADWLSDAVPHLVYGAVTTAVVAAFDRR